MDADQAAGIGEGLCDILDHDRRRIGRHHRARLHLLFQIEEQLLLDLEFLDDGLDDDVSTGDAAASRIGDQPEFRCVLGRLGLELTAEQFRLRGDALGDRLGREILQRHFHAGGDAEPCDVGTHHTGADDMHAQGLEHAVLRRLRLQHLRQLEDAAQILRCVGHHQRRECRRLCSLHLVEIAAVGLEQIDQAKRRGVVILARLLCGFSPHLTSQHAACRPFGRECAPAAHGL